MEKITILITDDRIENIISLEEILAGENRVFLRATSGNEALKLSLKNDDIGLIMLDVQMPDIDGLTVARHVRERITAKRPFIVAITAGVTPEDRQRCFDAGMDDFVMKPFKIATLKDVILKYARQVRPKQIKVPEESSV